MLPIFDTKTDYRKRVYGLDVFRAIAIILVVMVHGNFLIQKALPDFPWIPLMDGVELFFVLSGFLIGGIIIRSFNKGQKNVLGSLFVFWKRRWFRTLPNYYLILILNIVFLQLGWINGNFDSINYSFFVFTQNFINGFTGFFWESWSLAIEEWFYIIFPVLFIVLLRFLNGRIAFFITALALIFVPLLVRLYFADTQVDHFWWEVNFRKVVLFRLDSIGYGVLAAFIKHYFPKIWESRNFKLTAFILGLSAIIVSSNIHIDYNHFYYKSFYFSIIPLSACLLLPLADGKKDFRVPTVGKLITHISLISYSMYLINLGLVAQVFSKNFIPETATEGIIFYLIYWTIVITASTLIYKYFEKPVLDLRDR